MSEEFITFILLCVRNSLHLYYVEGIHYIYIIMSEELITRRPAT